MNEVTGNSPFELIHSFKFFSPIEINYEVANISNVNHLNFDEEKNKIRAIEIASDRIRKKVMYKNNNRLNFEFSWIGTWLVIEQKYWADYKIQQIEDPSIK